MNYSPLYGVIQKVHHLRQEEDFTKKVTKRDTGGGKAVKKMMSLTEKKFFTHFFRNLIVIPLYLLRLIILQRATIKLMQEATGASDIAILPDPKQYNSTNLAV